MSRLDAFPVHRCPTCRALATRGAQWCSLCYGTLGAAATAPRTRDDALPPVLPAAPTTGAADTGPQSADALVSLLAAQESARRSPQLGRLAAMTATSRQRAFLTLLGALVLCGALLVAMVLVGALVG